MKTIIALVGCGYIADEYFKTCCGHENIEVKGVFDKDQGRKRKFAEHYNLHPYESIEDILRDPEIKIVVNLTNPESHYSVSLQCIKSGKNVYSEKPLAMNFAEAQVLVELARENKCYISSAPCNVFSETAQAIANGIKNGDIGEPKLVYAEIDEGPLHLMEPDSWKSESGTPWPYANEFKTGVTLEHAAYYLTWFGYLFGPALVVDSFSSFIFKTRMIGNDVLSLESPDFTVACITYANGVVVRLTNSSVAPYNHNMTIVGDKGCITTDEIWHYHAPVYYLKYSKDALNLLKFPWVRNSVEMQRQMGVQASQYDLKTERAHAQLYYQDFAYGISEMAKAISGLDHNCLAANFVLHINEIVLAIHNSANNGQRYFVKSSFDKIS